MCGSLPAARGLPNASFREFKTPVLRLSKIILKGPVLEAENLASVVTGIRSPQNESCVSGRGCWHNAGSSRMRFNGLLSRGCMRK